MESTQVMVEAHAINTYAYCPRRCYYEYVEKVFYHNVYTIHGKLLHDHVDQPGYEQRGERELTRSLIFRSSRLGLVVKCDIVEEAGGEIYPVEYKRGSMSDWENNYLQLCAQAMAMEDKLGTTISYGFIFFYASQRRIRVDINEKLRESTNEVIRTIRNLFQQSTPPEGIDDWSRCKNCSLVHYCLPQERKKLKGKIPWERFI
ncbi:CRISPR-associated protein Cas4 [Marininema halotolerans]|uniref:CRISPR-associated protein Cas4 n=1 Tax=Marininema halotolerans TaxID=1155944 RepID=UPI000B89B7A9|nr:CRISPR-associated protein Cas4 [Marininema halotolerans]